MKKENHELKNLISTFLCVSFWRAQRDISSFLLIFFFYIKKKNTYKKRAKKEDKYLY